MSNIKKLVAGAFAASIVAIALPTYAKDTYIVVAPPTYRHEVMEARPGYVIVPGAWHWQHGKHEWVAGHYVAERKGYSYHGDRWVQHDNRKWTMQKGGWSHDSDGDGVPDNADKAPNNPRRQ